MAIKAYLKYSHCHEKMNEYYGAANGLSEAAFLVKDKKLSMEYLNQASDFYKIQGSSQSGMQNLKKFASNLIE